MKKRMLLVIGSNVMVDTDLDALVHLIADEWDCVVYKPSMLATVDQYDAVMLSHAVALPDKDLSALVDATPDGRLFMHACDIQFTSRAPLAAKRKPLTLIASLHPSIDGTAEGDRLGKAWLKPLHPDSRIVWSEYLAGLVHTIGPDIEKAAERAKDAAEHLDIHAFYWGIKRPGVRESLVRLGFGTDKRDACFGAIRSLFPRVRNLTREPKYDIDTWAPMVTAAEKVLLPYEPVKSEYQITRRLLECAYLASDTTVADDRISDHVRRFLDPSEWETYAKQVTGELLEILDEGLPTVTSVAAKHGLDLGPQLADDRPKMLGTLRHVLDLKPAGTAVEFGVGSGRSLRMIAEQMPAIGFDSFRGLPEKWRDGFDTGMFACQPPMIDNATLVVGLFEDTLPLVQFPDDVGLWHIDADLLSSTRTILKHIAPHLHVGAYVVFDEIHGWPGWENDGEHLAWTEFAAATGVEWDVIGHGPEQLALRITKAPKAIGWAHEAVAYRVTGA